MHRNNRKMSAKRKARMVTLSRAYRFAYDALRAPLPNTEAGLELCHAFTAVVSEMERTAGQYFYHGKAEPGKVAQDAMRWAQAGHSGAS